MRSPMHKQNQAQPAACRGSARPGRPAHAGLLLQRSMGNQAVQRLLPKLAISTPADACEQEADRVSEQVMQISDTQLQRVSVESEAEGAGEVHLSPQATHLASVDPGQHVAPSSVHDVLSSLGQPLDPATRAFMEPRFGQDFSNVRVHSGPAAEQSARDVNAQAYTVGPDIVFGAGRFAPGTHEGRRLLAHELTHVVQQSAGHRAGATLQCKPTEIDMPFIGGGLGFSGTTFDDSSVTFTPFGSVWTNGLATSYTEFPEASSGEVEIRAGTKAVVRIQMKMHIFEDNVFINETLDQRFSVDWNVSAAPDGTLTIDSNPGTRVGAPSSDTVKASLTAVNPSAGTDYVRVNPTVSTAGGSGSFGVGINVTTNIPGQFVTAPFTLKIRVKDIAPAKEPKGSVTIGPVHALRTYPVLFPPPRNRVGQDQVSSAQEQDLVRWYQTLTEPAQEQIKAGAAPVTIVGHASTTGDPAANRELSNRRMENVKRILRQILGSSVKFEDRSVGEYEAQTPDETEDQHERTVIVSVWEQRFEGEKPPEGNAP